MSLYQRGETWWAYIVHDGKRIRQSLATTDKREAQRRHDELKARTWERKIAGRTFYEAILAWIKEAPRDEADGYRIASFKDSYPDRALSDVTAESIEDAIKGKKPSTYMRYRNLLVAILNLAKHNGWIDETPRIAMRKQAPGRIRFLSREEACRLITELPDHLATMAAFSLATGLRQSNVTHLEWGQVDMRRRVAWIHPDQSKSGKPIGIPLSPEALAVMDGQIGQHDTWVFPYRGKPIGKIKTAWSKALSRAGIENFTWHDLRHTWASWHIMNGTPIEVLQKLGGWSDIRMVLRYAHLSPEHLAQFAGNSAPYSPPEQAKRVA
jgi:integrase